MKAGPFLPRSTNAGALKRVANITPTSEEANVLRLKPTKVLGVDLGIVNLGTDSDGRPDTGAQRSGRGIGPKDLQGHSRTGQGQPSQRARLGNWSFR